MYFIISDKAKQEVESVLKVLKTNRNDEDGVRLVLASICTYFGFNCLAYDTLIKDNIYLKCSQSHDYLRIEYGLCYDKTITLYNGSVKIGVGYTDSQSPSQSHYETLVEKLTDIFAKATLCRSIIGIFQEHFSQVAQDLTVNDGGVELKVVAAIQASITGNIEELVRLQILYQSSDCLKIFMPLFKKSAKVSLHDPDAIQTAKSIIDKYFYHVLSLYEMGDQV